MTKGEKDRLKALRPLLICFMFCFVWKNRIVRFYKPDCLVSPSRIVICLFISCISGLEDSMYCVNLVIFGL
jgi:hypothetical protein